MKFYSVKSKKTFTSNGQEKSKWLEVGTLKQTDDGKMFLELNQNPNETYFVFEPKDQGETQNVPF